MKIKKLFIIALLLLPLTLSIGKCSNTKFKVLSSPQLKWSENDDNNKPFTNGVNNPDSYGAGNVTFNYGNQFVDNLSRRYSDTVQVNRDNVETNAYNKYMALFLGWGGGSDTQFQQAINNYIVNEDDEGCLGSTSFYYNILFTPLFNLRITYEPYLSGIYYNDRGQGTREEDLTFEEYYNLATGNFLNKFYGYVQGGGEMRSDFIRYRLRMRIKIEGTDSFGNILVGDNFQKSRPKDASGNILPIPVDIQAIWNSYNSVGNYRMQNRQSYPTIDINREGIDRIYLQQNIVILEDIAQEFLGLDVIRVWDSTIGGTNSDAPSYAACDRGSYQGHNQLNIDIIVNAQSLGNQSSYQEGEYHGYKKGLKDGQAQWDWTNFLQSIFAGIDKFLSVEILPHIKLWYFVGIPLVFGLLKFILLWFR